LVRQVLLGEACGTYVKPLEQYLNQISASRKMNDQRWQLLDDSRYLHGSCLEEDIRLLGIYLDERSEWLYGAMNTIRQTAGTNSILLWMEVPFANPEKPELYGLPWKDDRAEVISSEQAIEANDHQYAVWEAEIAVSAADGSSLEGYSVFLNGVKLEPEFQEDGTAIVRAAFEDRSYLPADYYGEDVGLVYQFEQYIKWYPEVAQYCEYDEAAVMDYFFDQGIYEGHTGNGFFDPKEAAALQPYVAEYLYDDWSMYYWEFLEWGYEADWMENTSVRFVPSVTAIK